MNRRVRLAVFAAGAGGFVLLFALAVAGLPHFGTDRHPYRDLAVPAAVRHATANVVASVTFDQRGLDTLGEETIMFGSVVGTAALLRPKERESEDSSDGERSEGRNLDGVRLLAYVMLPVTLLIGLDLIVHGHLTPGGGFQGGIVLATGLHLLYLGSGYGGLERLRPLDRYEWVEGGTTAAFAAVGFAGAAFGAGFLANLLPLGHFQRVLSAGTVPLLNVLVGFAVGAGAVVLLAQFLTQALATTGKED